MTPTVAFYNLTPAAAQQLLQNDGLLTLGLTTVALSPHWALTNFTTYDDTTLILQSPGQLRAPFRGILQGVFAPASTVLTAPLPKANTTIPLSALEAAKFPTPQGGAVVLTISNPSGTKVEIVALTTNANNQLTITRGFEGSAIQDFEIGDTVKLRLGRNNTSLEFSGIDGQPLRMTCAVYRFHPQAVLRLERLMAARFETAGARPIRPVPHAMVVHNAGFYLTDQFFEADDAILGNGNFDITFHDGRGLIVDPVYVAGLFKDLLLAYPALQPATVVGNPGDIGGINSILLLKNGTTVHFINTHGATFAPVTSGLAIKNGNQETPVLATGLADLPQGASIKAAGQNTTLRFGWATNGIMTANDLTPPAPAQGSTLARDFFRVCAVDIQWALIGNRTGGQVLNVRGDDGRIPAEFLPEVRDQVTVDYLVDGPDTLSEIMRVLLPPQPASPNQVALAVSMLWDNTLVAPAALGGAAHWPLFPPANMGAPPAGMPLNIPVPLPPNSVSAAFTASDPPDVLVTLTGVAPFDSHVRIYPQQFVEIAAIGPEPSFVRGDGGSNIAAAAAVNVLLPNPFGRVQGEQPPSPAQLTLDIVITPRQGQRRLFVAVNVNVLAGPVNAPVPAPFVGPPVPPTIPAFQGIGPSPLFGVPIPPDPVTPNNQSFGQLLLSFVADTMPRQASRLPTQARLETLAVGGAADPDPNVKTLVWDAVVSGARFAPESRSAQHDLGNPGNPAGPDVHAPGVRVTGALGYDVAYAAMRRAEPMIPWPSFNQAFPGWIFAAMGDNFNPPSDAANTGNTSTGVLLRTIARACENSLISEKNIPSDAELDPNTWINQALTDIGIPFSSNVQIQNGPRMRKEVRREFHISKHGLRDAQWSLMRAISEARELVYIESAQFSQTAFPADPQNPANYQVDLVKILADRMQAFQNLKVIICTPSQSDFMPAYKSWAHRHYQSRTEAVGKLLAVDPDRVGVFHPVGFPGRPAFIRTTSVIVDDVWCLSGATHFRRRGMTFDGSIAVASFDRQMENGYSKKVRNYRQALMAAKLHVPAPIGILAPAADWVRLGRPESAFALVQDMLAQGGLGRIQPLWPGPFENVQAVQSDVSDPDGCTSDNYNLFLIGGVLNEAGN